MTWVGGIGCNNLFCCRYVKYSAWSRGEKSVACILG